MSACCGRARGPSPAEPAPESGTDHDAGSDAPAELLRSLAARAPEDLRMIGLAGGTFLMGDESPLAYLQEEAPVREVAVGPFALAATTVTVAQFAAFVQATGYRTDAEIHGDSLVFSGLVSEEIREISRSVAETPWWRQVSGASWHRPEGPGSQVIGREDHPVTHISQRDAGAYAQWVEGRLPSEAEWEFAARGGLVQLPYPWGGVREPEGFPRMNTFGGEFPDAPDGPVGTVAVTAFPPNGYGFHNMTGNVWEWTTGVFSAEDSRPVLRGGSYMCHASYCRRYRTSARSASTADTSLGHAGFRLAVST